MSLTGEVALAIATEFARASGVRVSGRLGFGFDGYVFRTGRGTAVKVFASEQKYQTERSVYERLNRLKVREIGGHSVPQLRHHSEDLLAIEMSIVQPPYLLDFAQSTLDAPPNFDSEAMEMWRAEKAEMFGDRWGEVRSVMTALELRCGVYLTDVNPGNITFGDVG